MMLLPVILILPYFLILLRIYSLLINAKKFLPQGKRDRFVSIVVACRNEEKNIIGLLSSLALQDYPREQYEIVIVDDHSTDKTRATAEKLAGELNIRVIKNAGNGKKEAIRTGILNSESDLIITTDADCMPGKKWISSMVSVYESQHPDLIAGPVRLTTSHGFFGKFQELEFLSLQSVTAGTLIAGNGTMCNGANLAFTRDAWLKSERDLRFDIATGDDVFLLHSLKRQKAVITWIESPDAIVDTRAVQGLKAFLKQRRRWASKSTAYRDGFSVFLGIVTFVTNLSLASSIVYSVFNPDFIITAAAVFILKSVPDFLMLHNTASRYGRRSLLRWFLPSQIIYPFYVMIITCFAIFNPRSRFNSGQK